jgi:hypothetical protein
MYKNTNNRSEKLENCLDLLFDERILNDED